MVQRCFTRYLLIFMLCLQAVSLSASVQKPRLSDLAVLEDKSGTENIQSISAGSNFRPLSGGTLAAGYTRSVHWLRFTVTASAGEWWLDILPPYLEDLRLYEPDPVHPGRFIERQSGSASPFDKGEVHYRGFAFKLNHADDRPRTYYLRLATGSTSVILPRLWAPETFFANSALEVGLLMSVLAILLTVMLFNVLNWNLRHDSLTLWFLAYLISMTINFAGVDGFIRQYLGFEFDWAALSVYPIRVSTLCMIAFTYAFYRRLFRIERSERILFWFFEGNFWLALLAIAAIPLGYYTETMPLVGALALLSPLVGAGMSIRLWRRKEAGAGLMLLANLVTMAGLTMMQLTMMGVIAGGFIVLHSGQIAALGSVIALQLALRARQSAEHAASRKAHDAARLAEGAVKYERGLNAQQGQLLSMLSHEMRNGLSVLRMAINFQPMPLKTIGMAERAIQGLSDVIERSLQSVKLVDGEVSVEYLPCDVAGLVEAVAADSQEPQRIVLDLAARPEIKTDPRLLRIILTNLVENAIKYGATSAPVQLALTIENLPAPNIIFRVGNAIGPAGRPDPAKVFEKYYRAPQTQGYMGSGVGLSLSKTLAGMLGGELRYLDGTEAVVFQLRL